MTSKPTPSPIADLNSSKLVVFYEPEPLTDAFEQVMLTPKQFKAVSAAVFGQMEKVSIECSCGKNHRVSNVITNEEHGYTFRDIKQCYTQKEKNDLK